MTKWFVVLLLDICKAFDLIDQDILLYKLKLYMCSADSIIWFTPYLKCRSQCTVLKGKLSAKLIIKTGLPRESITGPLLFILFINNLPLAFDKSNTDLYADDSSVTTSARAVPEIEQHLVEDADKVSKWLQIQLKQR